MAQTLKERTQNYVPFSILGKLFTWIRYLYVGGDLEEIHITRNKVVFVAVAGLFANWSTGYGYVIVVTDADNIILDQVRMWRVIPLKLNHWCIDEMANCWYAETWFYQNKGNLLLNIK